MTLGNDFMVQLSNDSVLAQGKDSRGGEKWSYSGCALNVEPKKLAVGFTWGLKERGVKDDGKVFILSNTEDGLFQD